MERIHGFGRTDGFVVIDFARAIVASVSYRRKNNRIVQGMVHNHRWIRDVGEGLGQEGLEQ
jgi:hypothetical protein